MIKVEIQNGVQTICQSAFMNTALKSAEIPESVLTIASYAFGYNKNSAKLVISQYSAAKILLLNRLPIIMISTLWNL